MASDRAPALRGPLTAVAVMAATALVAALIWWAVAGDDDNGPIDRAAPDASSTMPVVNGTPVPSPSVGTPSELGTGATVPVGEVTTLAPVPLTGTGDFGTGLRVRLAEITAVKAKAKAPGEISGPALRIKVEATNDGGEPVYLDGVVVFLSYGKARTPAVEFGTSSKPLKGSLAAGQTRTGSYVLAVPLDRRGDVRVEVSYTGSAPTVAFQGTVR